MRPRTVEALGGALLGCACAPVVGAYLTHLWPLAALCAVAVVLAGVGAACLAWTWSRERTEARERARFAEWSAEILETRYREVA